MLDVAEQTRLAELAGISGAFTRADYDLIRRRRAEIKDEEERLKALEAMIRCNLNLDGKL